MRIKVESLVDGFILSIRLFIEHHKECGWITCVVSRGSFY